jgi:hypothetical protein
MIDGSELRGLIANELRQLNDIEEIFQALVAFPKGPGFLNATRAELADALQAACVSLIGDTGHMPEATRSTIISVGAGAHVDLPAGDGASYSWGASAVDEAMVAFERRLSA